MSTTVSVPSDAVFKKCLKVFVSALSLECGFTHCDESAVDLLASVIQERMYTLYCLCVSLRNYNCYVRNKSIRA